MISDLYLKLKEQNIHIDVKDDNLDIKAPAGALTKDIVEEIKSNKADLIRFIKQYKHVEAGAIPKATISPEAKYPLSSSQLRLWVLSQSEKGNVAYNSVEGYIFEGVLDYKLLNDVLKEVIFRHESLRTVFEEDENGNVNQVIKEVSAFDFSIALHDLQQVQDSDETLRAYISADVLTSFDLSKGPLFRTKLYQLTANKWVFTYTIHHIIIDAWSMNIFISEILELYNSKKQNRTSNLNALRIQYKDYAVWENQQLSGKKYDNLKEYWLDQFSGEIPVLTMPVDKKRPILQTFNGNTVEKKIDVKLSGAIEKLIRENGATMFMGLTSVINTLLYKLSTQEDIVIGTPISGRQDADLQNQIGYYGNTLAIRMQFKKENTFLELLEYTKKQILNAFEHQMFPFASLVKELNLKRDPSRNPLFDVQVIYAENEDRKKNIGLEGLQVQAYELDEEAKTSRFDIVFAFYKKEESLVLNIQYNTDLFSEALISKISDYFSILMTSIVNNPNEEITKLDYIDEAGKNQILELSKRSSFEFDEEQNILDLFHNQVNQNPDSVAVVYKNETLSYSELNERSNRLANYLLANNVKSEELIPICLDRSLEMIIGIIGVLKAGAVYVPIDPTFPKERIDYIINDTSSRLLITTKSYAEFFGTVELIFLDAFDNQSTAVSNPSVTIKSDQLAYVIYTSGTTGKPKGALVEHQNVVSLLKASEELFDFGSTDIWTMFHSFCFDFSVWEIFGALLFGGKLIIVQNEMRTDLTLFAKLLEEEKVTILNSTPSSFQILEREAINSNLDLKIRYTIFGGESLQPNCLKQWKERYPNCVPVNMYGITETTVHVTFKLVTDKEIENNLNIIGKPIPTLGCYVLDDKMNLLPIGVKGELYVSGNGVTRGYLNRPELTNERFIPNPFEGNNSRLYKTGDLAKWTFEGELEYLGRIDEQVKVRGYRIELGEIEANLEALSGISQALVLARADEKGDTELVAYIISDKKEKVSDLRYSLSGKLPNYMIPSYYVQLKYFPLTINGKADKKKIVLLTDENLISDNVYAPPSNDIESALVLAFCEILKKENIGIKDDFFALGGDSIKAIQVVSKLKQKGYALAVQNVMQYPVIQDLAVKVKLVKQEIDQNAVEGAIPLTPIQKYFFEVTSQDKNHYNQSVVLKAVKSLSEEALTEIFQKLTHHHDALRSVFKPEENSWVQEIKNEGFEWILKVHSNITDAEFNAICDDYQASFDLEKGPLFKVVLLKKQDADYLLLLSHHLVIDGVSWRIILEDLMTLYAQYQTGAPLELPLKTHSLKYWQDKQLEYAHSHKMAEEEEYWSLMNEAARFNNAELPKDFDYGGKNLYKDFETKRFQLDSSATEKLLTEAHKAYKTNINDVLIAALSLAIGKTFDISEIVIQLEGHGREDINSDIDITRTVGWFTSIYPVMISLKKNQDNISQLIEVKETLHRIPNKGIGFGILKYLKGSALDIKADVSFNYLGDFDLGKTNKEDQLFEFTDHYKGNEIAAAIERKGILDVSGILIDGQLQMMLSFNPHYFKKETIENLKEACKTELEYLISCLSEEKETHMTPVDFTYKGLDLSSLEELNKML